MRPKDWVSIIFDRLIIENWPMILECSKFGKLIQVDLTCPEKIFSPAKLVAIKLVEIVNYHLELERHLGGRSRRTFSKLESLLGLNPFFVRTLYHRFNYYL